jgi:amino acid permease
MLAILVIGLIVPYDDQELLRGMWVSKLYGAIPLDILSRIGGGTAAQSPFVIAINRAGIKGVFYRCRPLCIRD